MGNKLVIVESPAKARTIGKMLGSQYTIKASMGHVRDLPARSFGVDIEHGFLPQYEETKERSKNLADLKSAAKKPTRFIWLLTLTGKERRLHGTCGKSFPPVTRRRISAG